MRLSDSAHTSRPWRIHGLTGDFRVEDVWALPTPGGPDDFPRLVDLICSFDPSRGSSGIVRMLFAIRWKVGDVFGWDRNWATGESGRTSLRARLPPDLSDAPPGPAPPRFTPLYFLEDEWAAEVVNRTVHGVLHLGWVPDETDGYRGEMAVLVKPNGTLGAVYMAAIAPFRRWIVYPRMLQELGRRWRPS